MAELMERKRLIEYLPRFMQNFSELKELLNAANLETDNLNSAVGRILDEAFIDSCTEYGLQKYEKFLHIVPCESESLEYRRIRVKARWYDYCPYTLRALVNRLNSLCGVGNYSLEADLENYYLKITTDFDTIGSTDELIYIRDSILPMNICFIYSVNQRIEIDVGERGIERFGLRNINFKTSAPFWRVNLLDGSWILDGSKRLDSERWRDKLSAEFKLAVDQSGIEKVSDITVTTKTSG